MALNDISFVLGQGGLGRALPGEDHISGMMFFTGSLPSGFSSSARVKVVYSVEEAEALGIVDTLSDATAATFTYQVTTAGTTGDTLNISVAQWDETVDLGTYTKVSGDNTAALVATAIAAVINENTRTHGYTATVNTATVTVSCPKYLGASLNTGTPVTVTIVGATIAGTLTQPSGATLGVASKLAVYHYHISEYFRVQPQGQLWLGFFAVPSTYDFAELVTLQNTAMGKIRQVGIYKDGAAFATANMTSIQTQIDALDALHKPISCALYCADISGTANVSSLTALDSLTAKKVSAVIGQDGAGKGYELWKAYGKSITCMGAALGAVSLAAVSQCIGWKGKFNMNSGTELDTLAFANGQFYTDISDSLLSTLNTYRYVFLLKNVGSSGSYFNDSHTVVSATSDYAYIENNRTIDKAIRGLYTALLPEVAGPIQLNADGTLADVTIAHLDSVAKPNLDQMVRDGDLSNYRVTINPAQDVLATSKVIIAVGLQPKGVARMIQVNIGFVTSV